MPDMDSRLPDLVTRIEGVQADIAEHKEMEKEAFAEAKALGYDIAALRKVLARRKREREEVEEEDAIISLYEDALDGRS